MDDVWVTTLERLLAEKERAQNDYQKREAELRKRLNERTTTLDREIRRIRGMKEDPVVLVRITLGPQITVYHSAERPCGRVRGGKDSWTFEKVLLGDAHARGLGPCSACGYLVDTTTADRRRNA